MQTVWCDICGSTIYDSRMQGKDLKFLLKDYLEMKGLNDIGVEHTCSYCNAIIRYSFGKKYTDAMFIYGKNIKLKNKLKKDIIEMKNYYKETRESIMKSRILIY
jgi:hypothetical protein